MTPIFGRGTPEYSKEDTSLNDTLSTENLVSNDSKVWSTVDKQMYLYIGTSTVVDLSSANYADRSKWKPIYKLHSATELMWYDADGLDISHGYYWFETVSDGTKKNETIKSRCWR